MTCTHKNVAGGPSVPADYVRCVDCSTFRSTAPQVDYTDDYWSEKHGHSDLYSQVYNCDLHTENGVSKSRFILDRIASDRDAALEIGCAPGRMLYWLKWAARFKQVIGMDPADQIAIDRISANAADMLITETFPDTELTPAFFDYILAADVFEHSTKPEAFLAACARLLKPGGQLFLMLPLADGLPLDSRMFNAAEHAWIHSTNNLSDMMEDAGFNRLQVDCWCSGHDTITGFKQ